MQIPVTATVQLNFLTGSVAPWAGFILGYVLPQRQDMRYAVLPGPYAGRIACLGIVAPKRVAFPTRCIPVRAVARSRNIALTRTIPTHAMAAVQATKACAGAAAAPKDNIAAAIRVVHRVRHVLLEFARIRP